MANYEVKFFVKWESDEAGITDPMPIHVTTTVEGEEALEASILSFQEMSMRLGLQGHDGFGNATRKPPAKAEPAPLPKSARAAPKAAARDEEEPEACGICGSTDLWDNRRNKKNPKGPDFKCKECKSACWLDSEGNLGDWQE